MCGLEKKHMSLNQILHQVIAVRHVRQAVQVIQAHQAIAVHHVHQAIAVHVHQAVHHVHQVIVVLTATMKGKLKNI